MGRERVAVRRTLLDAGFHEAIASTFCSAAEAALTAPQPGLVVPLGNPLSEEAGVLRPSLIPGMLSMIAGNLHRDVSDVRLFELGTVFSGTVSNGVVEKVEERPAWPLARWAACRSSLHFMVRGQSIFTM
jgi:phenylalanyl-tRNA synthetase beta chain